MKNPLLISALIIIIIIIGIGAYTLSQNSLQSDSRMATEETSEETKDEMMQNDESVNNNDKMMDGELTSSRYIQYSKLALDNASNKRRVLFFYASWCPTCRPADANFLENSGKIPDDVSVIRVNYNDPDTDQEEKDLAVKYGITYQHTYVQIDSLGNTVKKWNGGQLKELLSNLQN